MELFHRRYLCFICFTFVLTAFLLTFFGAPIKLILGIIAAVALVGAITFFIVTKKYKFASLFAVFICLAVSVSSFSSFFFVSMPIKEARSLVGQAPVLVKIVSKSGEDEYNVRLLRVGDRDVDIKADLLCDIDENFEYGDRLAMNAEVFLQNNDRDKSKLLTVEMLEESEVYLDRAEIKNYFSFDGVAALCHSFQKGFSEHVDKVFGNHSAIAKGLLVNDTSDISEKTKTDFKRSGTSHILAVSGTHIALLMGAVELILRKFEVKKGVRIVVISILSILFLALTAFVASAVRSVLMLFAVYLCYIFYEENDSITALFASIAIIILFSPFAVYDLGMWMSFLATLGILTVYPYFDEKIPYPKQENKFIRYSLRFLVWVLKALMLTLIANLFLLPIMWYFFGTVSISSLPCNLILGPIVTVLMPLCAFTTLIGFIPYMHIPFVFVTNLLFDAMTSIVEYFAGVRFGVISLMYEFAGILITLFAVSLVIMLVIRLKHRWVIFLPAVTFVVAFSVCVSVFNITSKPTFQSVKVYDSELIFVNNASDCCVVDMGKGSLAKGIYAVKYMSKYSTEIDKYFIVEPDENDAKTLNKVCKNTVVRTIFLPKALTNKDISAYRDIFKCAEKYNIAVELYDFENNVEICNGVSFSCNSAEDFSITSSKVKVNKQNGKTVCEYQNKVYDVGYDNGFSKVIPLN